MDTMTAVPVVLDPARKAALPEREARPVKRVETGTAYAGTITYVSGFGYMVRIPAVSPHAVFPWRTRDKDLQRSEIVRRALQIMASDGHQSPEDYTLTFKGAGIPTYLTITFTGKGE